MEDGELMLIHYCPACGKISTNRIAGDDDPYAILALFEESLGLNSYLRDILENKVIRLLIEKDRQQVLVGLFGIHYQDHV